MKALVNEQKFHYKDKSIYVHFKIMTFDINGDILKSFKIYENKWNF